MLPILIICGALLGLLISRSPLGRRLLPHPYPDPRRPEFYVAALPAVLATILAGLSLPSPAREILWKAAVLASCFAWLGHSFDARRLRGRHLAMLATVFLVLAALTGTPNELTFSLKSFSLLILWPSLLFLCLAVAGAVFEMPAMLLTIAGLTQLMATHQPQDSAAAAIVIIVSILQVSISAMGPRYLTGNSGHFFLAYLLGTTTLSANQATTAFLAVFLPTVTFFFPAVLISFIILASYFGNALHRALPDKSSPDRYHWNLSRSRLIPLTGLLLLTANLLGFLYVTQAPPTQYLLLCALFALIAAAFWRMFALREPAVDEDRPPDATHQNTSVTILNARIHHITRSALFERLRSWNPQCDSLFHILTADSLAVLRTARDPRFADLFSKADLVVPDGAGIMWAADFLGTPLAERIPGVGLVPDLCTLAAQLQWPVALVGAKQAVITAAAEKLRREIPNLTICFCHHGYVQTDSSSEATLISELVASNPRVVFVAMGVPRQEEFIRKLRPARLSAIVIGVGGSFDVITGRLPRAPLFLQRLALEWLFRLWLEPQRLGRILQIPRFVLAVLREKWNRPNDNQFGQNR